MKGIECIRGTEEMYDDYIDFINYVFGFNGNEKDMKKLLPNTCKRENEPQKKTYFIMEGGRIKASVGAFPGELTVCGSVLRGVKIGNVSVHPYSRHKGYMKALMNRAVRDMIDEKVDFGFLGGQRQRYNYFSFEKTGVALCFHVDRNNIRHACGDLSAPLTVAEVKEDDAEALDRIWALGRKTDCYANRARSQLYDIITTWQSVPYVFLKEGMIAGYCVCQGNHVKEIMMENDGDFLDAVRSVIAMKGEAAFDLPEFQAHEAEVLEKIAEHASIQTCEMFSVISYRRMLGAFLKLKATYAPLEDGEISLLIHGVAGDEQLCVQVAGGVPSVSETERPPLAELSHLEAERVFFSPICARRRSLPVFAQNWLPLPLWLYAPDYV